MSDHRSRGVLVTAAIMLAFAACGDEGSTTPDAAVARPDLRGGTVYEIFVRSFADSDGDGVGDLRGLTAKLDYLNDGNPAGGDDLGVDAVWLMPIFPSPSYHGYDVTDYRGINPQYGTLADFDAFLAAAHQRGIKVLIDFVINHSSDSHPWFVDSASGGTSTKRDWYSWSATNPGWPRPWEPASSWYERAGAFYYGVFCGCMPDLNLSNAMVEAELTEAMKFWLARGVDGFRLDAVRYFYENGRGLQADQPANHSFLKRLRASLQAAAPNMLLVAEAWASIDIQAQYRGDGDEVHLAFSFDLAEAIKGAAIARDASAVINILARSEALFPGDARQFEAPFLSNHDQVRVMRAFEGDAGAARVAAATLFAMPGTPFVYYGEEIGMLGGPGAADENKRTAMRWNGDAPGYGFSTAQPWRSFDEPAGIDVATQQAAAGSPWRLYRDLIKLRGANPALWGGDASRPPLTGAPASVLAVLRTHPRAGRVLFIVNFGLDATPAFTVGVDGKPTVLMSEGTTGAPSSSSGTLSIPSLGARGFAFIALS